MPYRARFANASLHYVEKFKLLTLRYRLLVGFRQEFL
jgi:hypothetical protein